MRAIGEDLFTVPGSFKVLGAEVGTRMTVLRVGRDLVLHSPVRIDDALAREIDALGTVRWIVAPSALHHLHVPAAAARWPHASVLGAEGVAAKQPRLALAGSAADAPEEWRGTIETLAIGGMPRANEVAFLHRPSGTLVLTDFLFNLVELESAWARILLGMIGSSGPAKQTRILRATMRDRAAVLRSRDALLEWSFDRVSVCHGSVIETDGRERLREATRWLEREAPRALAAGTTA